MTLCPGLPRWASTRKVKPVWILLEQETVSGSGISWAICKSAPRSRQITTPAPHYSSFFYRPDALPAAQPTVSKHWRKYDNWIILQYYNIRYDLIYRAITVVVHISSKLTWNEHIDITTTKASQTLDFIWRNFSSCPTHIREQCYKTLVRPQLEYALSLCDNTVKCNINKV